jgi:hypothetical protein
MREGERLLREADQRRQVFADGVRDGRRALAPLALLDGAIGILAAKISVLRPLREAFQRNPVMLTSTLCMLGLAISSTRWNGRRKSVTPKRPQPGRHTFQFKQE